MYILELWRHLHLISALRYRDAVRRPDGTLMEIKPRGHKRVWLRKNRADMETVEEIFFIKVYDDALQNLKTCRVFVDLGANIGLAAVLVKERFPECRVLALEPHPENFGMLKRNAPFAEAFQAAAWSSDSAIQLDGDSERFNAFQARAGGSIPAYSMNSIVSLAGGYIDFLKMDIEGAEIELFRNPEWLDRVNQLAIEFHGDSRRLCQFDAALQKYGLNVISESKHTTVAAHG